MDPSEIVLFTDCWDAFFSGTVSDIEYEFKGFKKPIVHSAEINLYPPECEELRSIYPKSPTRYRFINGGGTIGYAGALLARYRRKDFWEYPRVQINQHAYHEWSCKYDIGIDHNCRIFQCLVGDNETTNRTLQVREGRIFNTETNSRPSIIHGPGGGALWAAWYWERLKDSLHPKEPQHVRVSRLRAGRRAVLSK